VLQEEVSRLAGADREVLLHFRPLAAAKWRVGQHDVVTVLFLNIHHVLVEGVRVQDVRRFDAVQHHVHDADHIGEGLFLLPEEGALL